MPPDSPCIAPVAKSSASPVEEPGPEALLCPVPLVLNHLLHDIDHLTPNCLLSPGICAVSLPKNIEETMDRSEEQSNKPCLTRLQCRKIRKVQYHCPNDYHDEQKKAFFGKGFRNGDPWPRFPSLPPRRAVLSAEGHRRSFRLRRLGLELSFGGIFRCKGKTTKS